jgi:hypothetical protein
VGEVVHAGFEGAKGLGRSERELVGGQVSQWWQGIKKDPTLQGIGKAWNRGYQGGAHHPNLLNFQQWNPFNRQRGYAKQWEGRFNGMLAPLIEAESIPPAMVMAGDSYGTGRDPSVTTYPYAGDAPMPSYRPYNPYGPAAPYPQYGQAVRNAPQNRQPAPTGGIQTLDGGFLAIPGVPAGGGYGDPGAAFAPVPNMPAQPGSTPVQIVVNIDSNLADIPAKVGQALQDALNRMSRGPYATGTR